MITVQDATNLKHGDILEHVHNKDSRGNPVRARVSGQIKFWKTRPAEFRIPMKYGLYTSFYINEQNASDWKKATI